MDQTTEMIEPHIIVGFDRRITVPSSLKRIAVQYDHNVETVTFDCPRQWDGHDFFDQSQYAIYVNLVAPDGGLFSDPVTNVVDDADPTIMHFDWTVKNYVTQAPGGISFLICIKKVNESGYEVHHWNSELCTDLYVSKGLECFESEQDLTPDLVTKVLLALDKFEQGEYSSMIDRIVQLENKSQEYSSAVALHDQALESEATTRSTEDAKLRAGITQERADRMAADEALHARIDNAQNEATIDVEESLERLKCELEAELNPTISTKASSHYENSHDGLRYYSAKHTSVIIEKYGDIKFRMYGTLHIEYDAYPQESDPVYYNEHLLRQDEISQIVFGNTDTQLKNIRGFWHGISGIDHGDYGYFRYRAVENTQHFLNGKNVVRFVRGDTLDTVVKPNEIAKDFTVYFDIYGETDV